MELADQVAELIRGVLRSSNGEDLQRSEGKLLCLRVKGVDEYLKGMLGVLDCIHLEEEIRVFAVNAIKNACSSFSPDETRVDLRLLSENTVDMLKQNLMRIAKQEQSRKVRMQLGVAIGEIGFALLQENAWIGLLAEIWHLFEQESSSVLLIAFTALRILIKYSHKSFFNQIDDLILLVRNGLTHVDILVKVEAMATLSEILDQFERRICSQLSHLALPLLESVYSMTKDESLEETQVLDAVSTIESILESEGSFFLEQENAFYMGILKMITECSRNSVKKALLEVMISFFGYSPISIEESPEKQETILLLILLQMVQVSSRISEEWLRPSQQGSAERGDGEDSDSRSDAIYFGQNLISSFIPCFEQVLELVLKNLMKLFEEGVIKDDWRYAYAAMMAFSQVGEFVENVKILEPFLLRAYTFSFQHTNPLIRFAFCQVIGQISEDLAPLFQETYGEDLLPKMLLLLDDSVPRVRSHAAASLANLVDSMSVEMIQPQLDSLIPKLLGLAENGQYLIERIAVVPAFTSTAEAAKGCFEKYLDSSIQRLLAIARSSMKESDQLELCSNVLECISIISQTQRKTTFLPYLPSFVEVLSNFSAVDKRTNGDLTLFFDAWNRLTMNYSGEIAKQFSGFSSTLLKSTNSLICYRFAEGNQESRDPTEIQSALKMISTFASKFTFEMASHSELVYESIANLCASPNDGIRSTACECLPKVIGCMKSNVERTKSALKDIIKTLRDVIESENESGLVLKQVQCMNACIQEGGIEFLSDLEFEFLCNQLVNLLRASDSRKQVLRREHDKTSDPLSIKTLPMQYRVEEQLHLEIARLLGSFYKTHTDKALNFSASIYTNIVPQTFSDLEQPRLVQFGLILLQDIVTHIGFMRFHQKWDEIINVFFSQLAHSSTIVRQESLHGLSRIIASTPSVVLGPYTQRLREVSVEGIQKANELRKAAATNMSLKSIKRLKQIEIIGEHCVDMLGKLLKMHGQMFYDSATLSRLWITCLPIKHERQIAEDQHQIYMQYLILQIEQVQYESEADLQQRFELLAQFYDSSVCTLFLKPALNSFLRELLENPIIAAKYSLIFTKLTREAQKRLKSALQKYTG